MKYTSPIYVNEAMETTDVICESPYQIAYVDKVIGKDELQKNPWLREIMEKIK